ncbi:MAG: PAS domain S-box protein [Rhodothermaceae bacterium]
MGKITILLVEKNENDVHLFRELVASRPEEYEVVMVVGSRQEAITKLNAHNFDIIFTTLDLPDCKEFEIYESLRNEAELVPIIILDDTENKETAAKALQAGAQDYLTKDQLEISLLLRSIHYSIERMKLRRKVFNSQMLFQNLFEHSNQAIYILYNGKFERINKKFEDIFGYTIEELNDPGFDIDNIIPINTMRQNFDPQIDSNPIFEFNARAKNGEKIACEIYITYMNYKNSVAVQGIIRDITSKKATEKALFESEEKFRRIFENIPIGIYRATPAGNLTFANNTLCQMLGYSLKELQNDGLIEAFFNRKERQRFNEIMSSTGIIYAHEDIWQRKNGTKLYVLESARAVKNEKGVIEYYEGSVQDISDKKRDEHQLNLQNTALRTAANGIVITDKEGIVVWINPSFTRLTGYTEADVFGQKLSLLSSKTQGEDFYRYLWNTISTGHPWRGEIVNKRKNGALYVEEQTITPVLNEESEITHYIAIKQDITERKQTEQALLESEERFRGIYENAVLGIFRMNKSGKFQMANPALIKMLGYNSYRSMVITEDLNPEIEKFNTEKIVSLVENSDSITGVETVLKRKNGDEFFVTINLIVIRDENGKVKYYEGTMDDITKRKAIVSELIKAKETAEKSDKLKSEFLAQMSHEIRTPVNTILNFVSLIKNELPGNDLEEIGRCFDIIGSASARLIRTIDLMLNMSELQAGNYEYSPTKVDLYSCITEQIQKSYQKEAASKNIELNILNEADSTSVFADEYSIMQIFSNLLDNAIKYTPNGEILTRFYQDAQSNLNMEISDTGIGISDDYLPYIFEPFSQEEQGYTRQFEGNGLGLALVKKYCELNHCKIDVKSEKGKGTRFNIRFEEQSS